MNGRHEIEQRREQIEALRREHKVARLLVFGSVLRNDFNPETSDIDLMVEFLPGVHKGWLDEYTDLKSAMESLFSRRVDIITDQISRNPYFNASADREKELLCAA